MLQCSGEAVDLNANDQLGREYPKRGQVVVAPLVIVRISSACYYDHQAQIS